MILGIDTAFGQQSLDLKIPWSQGYRFNYVKLGGDNNPRYVSSYYAGIVDRSRQIGYRIGHYWVPEDSMDPIGAADFYVNNLRNWTRSDFVVLDNESFSGNDPDGSGPQRDSTLYSDAQAAAWVERVKFRLGIPGSQVLVYYGLADARARTHNAVLATGANFIIAAYSYAPFTFQAPSNIPMERIVGHQTGGIVFGGIPTDVNSFKDYAFDYSGTAGGGTTPINKKDSDMKIIVGGTVALVGEYTAVAYTSMAGAQGESIANNTQVYGRVDMTLNQVNMMLAEAKARRAALVAEVAAAVLASLPTGGVSAPGAITQQDIERIAAASAEATDAKLADDFAGIPEDVVRGVGEELLD